MNLTNKILGLSLAAVVGMASSSYADDPGMGKGKKSLEDRIAELEQKLKDSGGKGAKKSGIKISGYVDTSYIVNLADRDNSGGVAGASAQNTGRVFDNQFNSMNINAVKLTIEKGKDSSKFPAGFRVDTIYGEDANVINGGRAVNTTTGAAAASTANEAEFALHQAYINLGIPIGNGIDVKFGKMATTMSYEVMESPANWQFSRSEAYRLGPIGQTGLTLGYKWNDWLTSTVGVINGYDSGLGGGSAVLGSGNRNTSFSFVGSLDLTAPKISAGEFSGFIRGLVGNDMVTPGTRFAATAVTPLENGAGSHMFNVGVNWNKPFEVDQLAFGLDYFYRNDTINLAASTAGGQTDYAPIDASALTFYHKWDWNKWLTTSGRFGYQWYNNATARNQTGTVTEQASLGAFALPVASGLAAAGTLPDHIEQFNYTLTQAFNVWKDTLIRLEWRHDWVTNGTEGYGLTGTSATSGRNDIRQEQDTIAVNVVYSF